MDTLIRERNGKEEIWYSGDYLKQQIEQSYRAGIHKGIRVEFHAITPMNDKSVEDLTDAFKKRVEEEYQISYSNDEVIRIG
tara:strand:+ start:55 stop:297 length:243 start_codon:yes stop_codon:yes gene_type:complete